MGRALIACGGTGGHLSPGIALAQELISRGWNCHLLISSKKVDTRLIEKYTDIEYDSIPGSGLSFSPVGLFRFVRDFINGYRSCLRLMEVYRPDVVIGFGGFISASSLFAGARKGAKIAIHEANRVPGRATRLTSRIADRIFLPEGVSLPGSRSNRISFAGIPLRSEIQPMDKQAARLSLGLDPLKRTLLVFGGSQGARSLTEWSMSHAERLGKNGIQLICLAGLGFDSERGEGAGGGENLSIARFIEFSDDMPTLISAADLVVSRAGAGSLAEIARCGVPAILIPYPFAADDHQARNAQRFEAQGGGILLADQDLENLIGMVERLIEDDGKLERMRKALISIDADNSRSGIADSLEALISDSVSTESNAAAGHRN